MIFRSKEQPPQKPSNANRPHPPRRDPDLVGRPLPSQSTASATPNLAPPVNPVTAAQNRARQQQNPVNNFTRADQMRTLTVGRDISLSGEIATCDHLVVEGNVKATIKGGKMLEINETGTFSGTVDIEQADIAGNFDGELTVRGKLTIRPTANVTGVIQYSRLQVDTGAQINGRIGVLAEAKPAPKAEDEVIEDKPSGAFAFSDFTSEPGFLKASA